MAGRAPVQQYAVDRRGRRYPVHTPRLGDRCRCNSCHQRRYWTPERRAARAELVRQQFAAGLRDRERLKRSNLVRASHWTAEEDALLRELAGTVDIPTLAAKLAARHAKVRSDNAIKHRILRLGLRMLDRRPYTSSEVGRMFGISRETVNKRFIRRGLLAGTPYRGGRYGMRVFARSELERLIRDHPEAYLVETIRDSRLKALALAVQRGRPTLTTAEVARLTGAQPKTVIVWYERGLVASARKVRGCRPGAAGAWVIDQADLGTVAALQRRLDDLALRCRRGHARSPANLYVEPASGQKRCGPCKFGADAWARRKAS